MIELHIPSGEEGLITGLASFDVNKITVQNAPTFFYSFALTFVIAVTVGVFGAIIGAITQVMIQAISGSEGG